MAKEIKTQIVINASPEKVWAVLAEIENYPQWNTFITSISGELSKGNKIMVNIAPPDAKPMKFKPKVLVYEENKEIRWLGKLILPRLFDGEHIFELIDNGDGTTTFVHREIFKGLLVPFLKKMLDNNTRHGFIEMNKNLKERVEMAS